MADKKVTIFYSLKDKVSAKTKKMTKSFAGLKKALFSVKTAMAGIGFAALLKYMSSSAKAWGQQEKVVKSLNAALKNAGNYSDKVTKSLQEQASALQDLTLYGDEEIIQAQSLLAQFGLKEDAIKSLTQASLDLASATDGMSLSSAASLVAKSVGSTTNALSRYGIEVTGAVGSTERIAIAVKNMGEKFGGQALANASGLAGSIAKLQHAAGDLFLELTGKGLSKVINELTVSFIGWKNSLKPETVKLYTDAIHSLATGVVVVAKGLFFVAKTKAMVNKVFFKGGAIEFAKKKWADFSVQLTKTRQSFEEFLAARNKSNDTAGEGEDDKKTDKKIKKLGLLSKFQNIFSKKYLKGKKQEAEGEKAVEKDKAMSILGFARQQFAGTKAMKIAEAVINTYKGATQALATYPPPLSYAFAAAVIAQGFASVSKMKSQDSGGYTDGGIVRGRQNTGDHLTASVNSGEMIINRGQQQELMNISNGNHLDSDDHSSEAPREVIILDSDGEELTRGIIQRENQLEQYGAI